MWMSVQPRLMEGAKAGPVGLEPCSCSESVQQVWRGQTSPQNRNQGHFGAQRRRESWVEESGDSSPNLGCTHLRIPVGGALGQRKTLLLLIAEALKERVGVLGSPGGGGRGQSQLSHLFTPISSELRRLEADGQKMWWFFAIFPPPSSTHAARSDTQQRNARSL